MDNKILMVQEIKEGFEYIHELIDAISCKCSLNDVFGSKYIKVYNMYAITTADLLEICELPENISFEESLGIRKYELELIIISINDYYNKMLSIN